MRECKARSNPRYRHAGAEDERIIYICSGESVECIVKLCKNGVVMSFDEAMKSIGMNMDEVLARFSGSRRLVEKFVRRFPSDKTYGELEQAMGDKDYEQIERAAHTLKGVCANLGFTHLYELSSEMVNDVRACCYDKLDSLFDSLTAEYEKVKGAIEHIDEQ